MGVSLDETREFLQRIGIDPRDLARLRAIHIAGTKVRSRGLSQLSWMNGRAKEAQRRSARAFCMRTASAPACSVPRTSLRCDSMQ